MNTETGTLKIINWPDEKGKLWLVSERLGFGYTPIAPVAELPKPLNVAPELLEALKDLLNNCGHDEYVPDDKCIQCTKAKAAILKAEKGE